MWLHSFNSRVFFRKLVDDARDIIDGQWTKIRQLEFWWTWTTAMVHRWSRFLPPPTLPRITCETSQHQCSETEEHDRDQAGRRSTSTAAEDIPTPLFLTRRIHVSDYAGRGRLDSEFSTQRWQQRQLRHWTCRAVERYAPHFSSCVWRPGIPHRTTGP